MLALSLLALIYCAQGYILSGYICPQCTSAPNPNWLIQNINKNYTRVNIAFIIYNKDGTVAIQFNDPSKNFTLTPQMISDLKAAGFEVFISIGGGAGPTLDCNSDDNSAFMNNFVQGVLNITSTYGFDGVDFDIEHRSGDYVKCAELISNIMNELYANKLKISIAPQMPNLYPDSSTVSAGTNELAPLIAMENATVLESVQAQMYNSWAQVETVAYAEKYVKELNTGYTVKSDGNTYFVQVPNSQLVLGYPSSRRAAGNGYIDPSNLKSMYETLKSEGLEIQGFMTWSIGWDQQNNWDFANTLGNL